jgi:hypothetical protein
MRPALLLAGLLLASPLLAQDEDEPAFPPAPFAPDRYEAMMKRSPFVLPTPETAEEAKPATNWTADFRIASIVRVDGEYMVLVRQVSTDERIPVRQRPNRQGIRLVEVRMSSDPRGVSATLERDGEQGTVQYDDSVLSQVPRSMAPDNPALKAE